MIENNKFNPAMDIGLVIVGLNVDINDMIETHSIPATAAEVVYNNITDIDDVGSRIDDTFDGIMIARAFNSSIPSPNAGTGSSQGVAPTASPSTSSASTPTAE